MEKKSDTSNASEDDDNDSLDGLLNFDPKNKNIDDKIY